MVWNAALRRGLMCVLALWLGFTSAPCKARIYTNHWAVRINGGPVFADRIADKYGYKNMGQVCFKLFLCYHFVPFTFLFERVSKSNPAQHWCFFFDTLKLTLFLNGGVLLSVQFKFTRHSHPGPHWIVHIPGQPEHATSTLNNVP